MGESTGRLPHDASTISCVPWRRPYPGAFTDIAGERYRILQTRRIHGTPDPDRTPRFCARNGACIVVCADGEALELRSVATRSGPVDLQRLARKLSTKPLLLCEQAA
jgi:hypothetical protein